MKQIVISRIEEVSMKHKIECLNFRCFRYNRLGKQVNMASDWSAQNYWALIGQLSPENGKQKQNVSALLITVTFLFCVFCFKHSS